MSCSGPPSLRLFSLYGKTDFSRWRYFSLAGGILLILAYQEFLIDDKRFPVAGYDLDRREEWDNSLDNYRLYQLFKRILVRTGMDPTERLQLHADQLVDDVHGGRITKTWNSYDKPLARYSDHASRPFTDIIGHGAARSRFMMVNR